MYMNALRTFTIIFSEYISYLFHRDQNRAIINIGEQLATINFIYIKFLQAISSSAGISDESTKERLTQYSDNVPYEKEDIDFSFLKQIQEKGIFLKSQIPINSGLIAVVFRGASIDGHEYAIKVKRCNIYAKMMDSVREIEYIIDKLENYDIFKKLKVKQHFERNRHILFDQIDFECEIENIELFHNNFKNIDYVIIPKVYKEFTQQNSDIIVMDFIKGTKLSQVAPEAKESYCKLVANFGLKSFFFDGVYHGDMHQGNIFFIKDDILNEEISCSDPLSYADSISQNGNGSEQDADSEQDTNNVDESDNDIDNDEVQHLKLGIIDFGIIGKMNREEQNNFYEFLNLLYSNDFDACGKYAYDNLLFPEEVKSTYDKETEQKIVNDMTVVLKRSMELKMTTANDIYDINKILSRYNLELKQFFADAQLALIINNTLCNNLAQHSETSNFIDIYGKEFMNLF